MKILKAIAKNAVARIKRAWQRATEVDYESYLRERAAMEERERLRLRCGYGRGWWL